ncbi:MAG TPA: ABC transporter permease [Anaerolineae bacterium]|nr:ABC transporter permease [Anaerolineae bacterium]HOQ97556.1 ABC transporter permease [Anaerolineae bacterium]HPL28955.1 ABC transporter permease [Anaerolineae bacterium]
MRGILRVLAFIGKEVRAILVQPQLLLLLVAGPFLILLAFGLGYRPVGPTLRTIVVQPATSDAGQPISSYLGAMGPPIQVTEVTADLAAALRRLQDHQVDLVVVVPDNIRETLLDGQNAHLVFYHNAIDPAKVGYISAVIDGATGQINQAIVKKAVGEQQATAADYEQALQQLQDSLTEMRSAVQQGDRARAAQLSKSVRLSSGLIAGLWLLSADSLAGPSAPAVHLADDARRLDSLLAATQSDDQAIDDALGKTQDDVGRMLQGLQQSQRIPASVYAAPLVWDAKPINAYQPSYVVYHSPTVLALLVQHLCITLAALSLVDERNAGAVEIFRVGPAGPNQILIGKFIAYVLVVSVTAVGLVALLVYALSVPVLGSWFWFVAVLAALMAYSLNLGFLISAWARSRSQAIQMSMLALLGSIFFSGFFVPLSDFAPVVRAVSYSLPVTFGIELLRQVTLQGQAPQPLFLGALVAWAAVSGFLAVRLFRRLFVSA